MNARLASGIAAICQPSSPIGNALAELLQLHMNMMDSNMAHNTDAVVVDRDAEEEEIGEESIFGDNLLLLQEQRRRTTRRRRRRHSSSTRTELAFCDSENGGTTVAALVAMNDPNNDGKDEKLVKEAEEEEDNNLVLLMLLVFTFPLFAIAFVAVGIFRGAISLDCMQIGANSMLPLKLG